MIIKPKYYSKNNQRKKSIQDHPFILVYLSALILSQLQKILSIYNMKNKVNIETLKGLLQNQNSKQGQLRNIVNQSYHEYQFYNLDFLKKDLIESLIKIYTNDAFKSSVFEMLIKNIDRSAASLLTLGSQIMSILETSSCLKLSHKESYSQSLLLSLILAKEYNNTVDYVILEKSLKGIGHLIADQAEADKLGFAKEVASKQGISIHSISDWQPQSWVTSQSIIVIDVFGLNPVQYRPFLLKNIQKIQRAKKVVIYHSHLQDDEIQEQLRLTKREEGEWLQLQVWPQYPFQSILQKDQKAMLDRLFVFLKEDSVHAEKQDVVIFLPPDSSVRKFSGKLSQQLSKHHLKESVTIVSKPHLSQNHTKNHIFLVTSASELKEWDYDYSYLFYVIDYEIESGFYYDYNIQCYIHTIGRCSGIEKARRMAVVGSSRIGRYVCFSSTLRKNQHFTQSFCQLSSYIIKMVYLNLSTELQYNQPRLIACLELMQELQIIRRNQNTLQIADERIFDAAKEGINPIEAKLIYNILDDKSLSQEQRARIANLMIITYSVLHNSGNLRQSKQEKQSATHIKPNGMWRKSGYLESCLQIMTKYDLIQARKSNENCKSETFRRKTSKMSQNQYEFFGTLFQVFEAKKKTYEDMDQTQFLRECAVNHDLFLQVREEILEFRDALNVNRANIIFEKQDLNNVTKHYLNAKKKAVAINSGSRRQGYIINSQLNSVFPDKTSLLSQLNERPELLLLLRLSKSEQRYEILLSNSFCVDQYMQIFGKLPIKKIESHSQMQVQFHGISNTVFDELWKNNGTGIVKFQTEHSCFIEPNQEMAMIVIHCGKEKSEEIKGSFESVLIKIREKLSVSNKIVHYIGNTNLILGAGGSVKQIIKSNYIDKCILSNLHLDVTQQDLEQLFEEFFVLKKIVLKEPQPGKFFRSAIIHFISQRDYYRFIEYFNQCLYFDRLMDVKPLTEERASLIKAQQYIEFKWFVWKSHLKALVQFTSTESANKALQAFKQYPQLDGTEVVISGEGTDIIISNLKEHTDQICIEQAFKGFGEIREVQILKTPLKEISGDQPYLQNLIKNTLVVAQNNNQQPQQQQQPAVNFKMEPIEKCKNGLRVCRVHFDNIINMNKVANDLNKTIGKLGEGRLYAQTWFQMPILVPHGAMPLYQQILNQVYKEGQQPNLKSYIKQENHKSYIILKSPLKNILDAFYQKLMATYQGYPIDFLTELQKSIILSEIGLANLLDMEQKYHCKLIVNQVNRSLHVLCADQVIKSIKNEIKSRVADHFFYRLSLNSKTFKNLKTNPDKLKQIKTNFTLQLTELEVDSKALLLQGSAFNVQRAFNYLMHFIESLNVPQEQMINSDVCGICCSEPHRPYRLQKCSHKFCRSCLLQYLGSVLGDNSLFPMKCPHCCQQIVIDDLQSLIQPGQWAKVQIMATNQYVAKHAQIMTFCFTNGCRQINMIKNDHIQCDVCLAVFCIECKNRYHPGLSCQEAKAGGDELFKKYMLENGIRQCPNDKCKIPVVRIDGCYRVTCSRCNKSMCFKCEPEKMIAYNDYNECYKHLNDVHGGYW